MSSDELDRARQLMESAERETSLERKLADLEEALDMIDDFLTDHSEAGQKHILANNLRRTHLHRLIEQLVDVRSLRADDSFGIWFSYLKLFMLRVPAVVDSILIDDSTLRRRYQEFLDIWMPDLLKAAESIQTKQM